MREKCGVGREIKILVFFGDELVDWLKSVKLNIPINWLVDRLDAVAIHFGST